MKPIATDNAAIVIERLRRQDEIPADLNGLAVRAERLDVCDSETLPLAPLLYQAGYLTIRSVGASGLLELGIPNREIDDSLHDGYVRSLLGDGDLRWEQRLAERQEKTFSEGASDLVASGLRAAFAQIPHDWRIGNERETKRYFLLYLKLLGADVVGEIQSARGRADAVLKARDGIWVFGFKYGRSAREALDQARTRDYACPWLSSGLPVRLVGINYDPSSRSIDPPLVEDA